MIETSLAVAITIYGIVGALASPLQLRRVLRRKSSEDVSLCYLSVVAGGYLLWLAYGVALANLPLIQVDAPGGVTTFATLAVAWRFRKRGTWRPPLYPASWAAPERCVGAQRGATTSARHEEAAPTTQEL
jgi:MtN3 and saliva related transmembrane protein